MNTTKRRTLFSAAVAAACTLALTAPTEAATPHGEAPATTQQIVELSRESDAANAIQSLAGDHPVLETQQVAPTSTTVWGDRDELVNGRGAIMAMPSPADGDDPNDIEYMSSDLEHSMVLELPDNAVTHQEGGAVIAETPGRPTIVTQLTTTGRAQAMGILNSPDEELVFDFQLPAGHTWETAADGGLHLIDSTGTPQATVDTPWAVDANGQQLPTHYVVEGESIRQVVDTTDAAFPVVADPSWWWWTSTGGMCATEIAGIAFAPLAAVKVYNIAKRLKTVAERSSKVRAAVQKVGGYRDAVKAVAKRLGQRVKNSSAGKYIPLGGLALTATQQQAADQIISFMGDNIWDFMGFGSCGSIIRELT
ncbi:hypothetical protein SAMN05445756_2188 [Kytococcus aerolatus]|uniref:Uncharacterized protein n=1 Tax=Kytococcus aerolatus TaxID=592308 RepID=A0A212U7Z7_9MICO|nr:hypothetical protein [Kytococcus aerolatus]SNC74270.1 hypothetical protein SAMN05445756_2188 [Kytococcus aerolatus]